MSHPRKPLRRVDRLVRGLVLLLAASAVSSFGAKPLPPHHPVASATAHTAEPLDLGDDIAHFYRARAYRPVWIENGALRPEARQLLAAAHDPELTAAVAAAEGGDRYALTRADLLLTRAYVAYAPALTGAPRGGRMRYIDPGLAPRPWTARDALAALDGGAASAMRRNPAYDGLVRGLAAYRERWSRLPRIQVAADRPADLRRRLGLAADASLAEALREFQHVHGLPTSGRPDPATLAALNRGPAYYERLILANIERAKAIPPMPGRRYVLVDTASARLWMVEDARLAGTMRVIVGKPVMQSPEMAGLIRYAALNPYWNLPPDLIRKRARNAARRGAGVITGERLQVLSDWTPQARPLDPRHVDWAAVAAGRRLVNLRQLPGPQNMMGRIKFMLPNDLGVYLHDTPLRELFAGADRRQSSGCIRLEDAMRLGRWLFRGAVPVPSGQPEQRVDLPEPVPVYITYLTVLPSASGVIFRPDSYRRDPSLLATLG